MNAYVKAYVVLYVDDSVVKDADGHAHAPFAFECLSHGAEQAKARCRRMHGKQPGWHVVWVHEGHRVEDAYFDWAQHVEQ